MALKANRIAQKASEKLLVLFTALAFACGCGKDVEGIGFDRSSYEDADFDMISIPEGMEAFTLYGDGNVLCSSADAKLYTYGQDGGGKKEIPSSSFYGNLCVDGGDIYAYDYEQSAVVRLGSNGEIAQGDVKTIQNALSLHTIRNMVALNGEIYVLAIPFTTGNAETFYTFGMGIFEDYGETVYCIDAGSGQYRTVELAGHITAEYRTEDGRLFFYGWQEEQYCLYEYDTEKRKVARQIHFDGMGNLLNIVVEGGYLFGISPSDGLTSIDLATGEKLTWASGIYAIFGNDLQFYKGSLFVRNMAATQEVQKVLAVDREGGITEKARNMDTVVADGTGDDEQDAAGINPDKQDGDDAVKQPAKREKRNETIGLSTPGYRLFNTGQIRHISGMKTRDIDLPLDMEAIIAELMAGNPDVDIYMFPHAWPLTDRVRELGLYVPLNASGTISSYIGKCFGYIQDAATNANGDFWMVPVYGSCNATWYIPENMQKFGVAPEELTLLDSYIAVLERLHDQMGKYYYYNNAYMFLGGFDGLYDENYNNYETGEINFNTELYRHFADFFWTGWDRYGSATANHPLFFKVLQQTVGTVPTLGETPDFDRNCVIFKTISIGDHLVSNVQIGSEKFKELLEGWRVLPFPKLQSESEKEGVALIYAFVNPYSRQQEAATEYLEVVLENQTDIVQQPLFFREDMAYYEQYYDTTAPAFQDLYAIFKNSIVYHGYSWDLSDAYITEYQQGLISFDEAIERRQRSATMGLYE